jgi:hypothetical protein
MPEIVPPLISSMCPGTKDPKMSPYANRNSIAIQRAEIFSRTPILTPSAMWESEVIDTVASIPSVLFRAPTIEAGRLLP